MTDFSAFYSNPVIQVLADNSRWTVSDNQKMPLNLRELIKTGRIWGAHEVSDETLVTLPELVRAIPNAANNCYYLRSQIDGVLVLDIEKTCPPDIAQRLLKLPNYYSETSMSGKGYHLVMPLPTNFWNFPIATAKKKLQEKHGYYEILMDHWVTFTRNALPPLPVTEHAEPGAWEELWEELASLAVETPTVKFDIDGSRPAVPRIDQMVDVITRNPIEKSLDQFHGDHSRYEFSVLAVLYHRLKPLVVYVQDLEPDAVYDEAVKAWVIYEAATKVLEYRDKHDEMRNGLPLLLNAATDLISRRIGSEKEEAAKA